MAKEYYLYVKGKAIPVSEEVYKAYEKQKEKTKDYCGKKERQWFFREIGYNINDKKMAFREFTNLTFLKISVILSVNKEGVPLPLKVEH